MGVFEGETFDFILSVAAFIEIPSKKEMTRILKEMRRVLKKEGLIVIVTATPETYTHNWASFICDFPGNRNLKSGDKAKLKVRGTDITFYDYIWTDKDYREVFGKAGLNFIRTNKPLPQAMNRTNGIVRQKPLLLRFTL